MPGSEDRPKAVVPEKGWHDGRVIQIHGICEYVEEVFPTSRFTHRTLSSARRSHPDQGRGRGAAPGLLHADLRCLAPAHDPRNGAGTFNDFLKQGAGEGTAARASANGAGSRKASARPGAGDQIRLYHCYLRKMEDEAAQPASMARELGSRCIDVALVSLSNCCGAVDAGMDPSSN